jgi:hypothetical protein
MERLRARTAAITVSIFAAAALAGLGVANATPGHGRHGPCEHGRHVGNPHCRSVAPSSSPSPSASSSDTSSPTPDATPTAG